MISILMPIYNGIEYINDSVESILDQTYDNWELIIGVNGHPQKSFVYNIANTYNSADYRIKVLDLHNVKGKSNALNEMVKYCKYDYIALLDVDDIWLNNKLSLQSPYLNRYDVIGTNCVYFGEIEGVIPKIPNGDFSNFDFTIVNPIINSSSIIRKELCFWKEKYDGVEDYDLWIRLRKDGKKFYNCSDVLVKHRIHNQSAFNTKDHSSNLAEIKRQLKN
jgi:glycosyltransferase involved in cell wall biosynthesis